MLLHKFGVQTLFHLGSFPVDHLNLSCHVGRDLLLSFPEAESGLGLSVVLEASLLPCHWALTELTLFYYLA